MAKQEIKRSSLYSPVLVTSHKSHFRAASSAIFFFFLLADLNFVVEERIASRSGVSFCSNTRCRLS